MTKEELFEQIKSKRSFLCVGLDTDLKKIPAFLHDEDDPIFAFNKAIIDATATKAVAFKPNVAFYEALGPFGIQSLSKTTAYIREKYPEIFLILDAKRGDIGNTSDMYAASSFTHFKADAVTVSPYMGSDSAQPFLNYPGKWAILLALTSNAGSADFQHSIVKSDEGEEPLFERVLKVSQKWENADRLMYVVGATQASSLSRIRELIPDSFLLVPGVGAQGGSLEDVAEYGMNDMCGLLVNSSRGIIYADHTECFATRAADEAESIRRKMEEALIRKGLL